MPLLPISKESLQKLVEKNILDPKSLIIQIKGYMPNFDDQKFLEALEFAAMAHQGQMRKQIGVPYIVHPFETTKILVNLHADETTLIASLLHDVPEDTEHSLKEIASRFGPKVAYLVEGITKLSKVHYRNDMLQRDVETLQKLFVHIAEDPRTILIKLADRLHNMCTLEFMENPEKRIRKARETLEIFGPIAGLLGIRELQTELEELCFINLFPKQYTELKKLVEQSRKASQKELEQSIEEVKKVLKENGMNAVVYSKYPTIYSIFKSLTQNGKNLNDYEQRFRFDIIVDKTTQCYQSLGIIHSLYRPVPGAIRDYISSPKPAGYQGLHTTAFGIKGIKIKFLIRTNQMNIHAQYGIVANNFINKPNTNIQDIFNCSQWVEEAINIQKADLSETDYLHKLKSDIFIDKINIITPKGDAIELPKDSTCIDFSYAIHTQVGNRAIRAQVNNLDVPLNHILKKRDVVKIITTDYPKAPNYEWLFFAKTPLARNRIKEFFKKESRASKIQLGRKILQKEYDRAGLGIVSQPSKWKLKKIATAFSNLQLSNLEDILVNIAEGAISAMELVSIISPVSTSDISKPQKPTDFKKLIKLDIKVKAEPDVNFSDLEAVISSHKDFAYLLKSKISFNPLTQKVIVHATILVRTYNDISKICTNMEHLDGVIRVDRLFWKRKIVFFIVSIFTFAVWIIHPFIMNYIASNWIVKNPHEELLPNSILFAGLFVLVGLIFTIKNFTENSIPELRESPRLWVIAYVLCFFAFLTIVMEIYFFHIEFNWILALISMVLVFAYLTGHYLFQSKDNQKL